MAMITVAMTNLSYLNGRLMMNDKFRHSYFYLKTLTQKRKKKLYKF